MSFLFGGGDDGSKDAARARADEEARQARIRAGTQRISEIFSGGAKTGTGAVAAGTAYNPAATYYDASGNVFVPKATAGKAGTAGTAGVNAQGGTDSQNLSQRGTGGGRTAAITGTAGTPGKTAQQAFIDALNAGQVFSGTSTSKGAFDEDFFKNRRQAYIDYATPQLQKQFQDAQRELTYSLDRGGNLASSTNATQTADLGTLYKTNEQAVADKALGYETEARTAVEDARSDLVKTLNATGDAEGAATSAINRASALSRPDTYTPLSQLFADFTSGLGTQAALERAEASSRKNYAKYDTGLFAPGRVSNK
jgi:hypothetical protein